MVRANTQSRPYESNDGTEIGIAGKNLGTTLWLKKEVLFCEFVSGECVISMNTTSGIRIGNSECNPNEGTCNNPEHTVFCVL